ncbi:MAG TPA: hypothetical protein VGR71_07575 [Nitrospira sp.]|nr:hypothetical protein [Nitrospira sp.]
MTELNFCSKSIEDEINHLRDEVKEALFSIEDALRAGNRNVAVGIEASSPVVVAIAN